MKIKLTWIVVEDLDKAVNFYTKVVGLELRNKSDMFKWAELIGEDGCALGIAQTDSPPPGSNAIVTLTVDDIEESKAELELQDVKMLGDIVEVPGHVKMQMFIDPDGNHLQLVEQL